SLCYAACHEHKPITMKEHKRCRFTIINFEEPIKFGYVPNQEPCGDFNIIESNENQSDSDAYRVAENHICNAACHEHKPITHEQFIQFLKLDWIPLHPRPFIRLVRTRSLVISTYSLHSNCMPILL
ncbi:hypothetical protein PMAYCL1PPCAC_12959, partial [Pristionchus mayeri]